LAGGSDVKRERASGDMGFMRYGPRGMWVKYLKNRRGGMEARGRENGKKVNGKGGTYEDLPPPHRDGLGLGYRGIRGK